MNEENLKALREKIQAKFDEARSQKPPARKKISEEQRLAQQQTFIELLYRAAEKQIERLERQKFGSVE